MESSYYKILECLGNKISKMIFDNKIQYKEILEIRITVNKEPVICTKNKIYKVKNEIFSIKEIQDIFASFCEFSVHTYKNEICEGFITYKGGIRIGICGTAIYEDGKIVGMKDISALNIRIPHEIENSAKELIKYKNSSILIIGPPCSGKTTVLRDFSKQTSFEKKVCIVDERMEISGTYHGIPCFDIGFCTVLNGFIKKDGIKSAVRSMAPDIIVCDEFGDENDIRSAVFAMKSGVKIVASMHAFNEKDFLEKPFSKDIIRNKIFDYYAFLDENFSVYKIIPAEDFDI